MTPVPQREGERTALPRTLLYIHRMQLDNPTGVHRYSTELATSLADVSTGVTDIELCAGRERRQSEPQPLQLPITHPSLPRRPLHLAWTLFEHPKIERVVGHIDLLHMLLPAFPIRSSAPQVMTIHDLLPLHRPDWYRGIEGYAVRAALRRADRLTAVITPSQAVADDVIRTLRFPASRIRVIPEGVPRAFTARIDEAAARRTVEMTGMANRDYLITVGAVSPRKNLATVFAALAELNKRGIEAPDLLVVGSLAQGAQSTKQAAERHGIADLVHFTGHVDDTRLQHLLSNSIGLVHPSIYEGFGLTPLEAMAAGTPVITSDAGALAETVGPAAILVDPHDPAAWADAIHLLTTDSSVSRELIEAGHERVSMMTWDRAAHSTLDLYRSILDGVAI